MPTDNYIHIYSRYVQKLDYFLYRQHGPKGKRVRFCQKCFAIVTRNSLVLKDLLNTSTLEYDAQPS